MDARGRSPESDVGATPAARLARRTMVAVVGVLALWAVVPALASARVAWRQNGTPLSESIGSEWKGTLRVSDTKTPVGEQGTECADTIEGSSGIGGMGEVTKIVTSSCVGTGLCETKAPATLTPVNLPWHTELAVVEGTLRDVFVSGGKGTPGFKIKCKIGGDGLEDECSGTLRASTTNTESGVTVTFRKSEKLTCVQGGSGSGYAEGSQSDKSQGLSAEKEEPPVWLRAGVPIEGEGASVRLKGTITLRARPADGPAAVSCEDEGSGVAGLAGVGDITELTISKCSRGPESECIGEYGLKALDLPWSTSLFSSGSTVRDQLLSDGSGVPGLKLTCEYKTAKGYTIQCEGKMPTPAPAITNAERGVTAEFTRETIRCGSGGGETGELEGTQTITLASGETLHVS